MRLKFLICLIIFLSICVERYSAFNVNFHYNFNLQVEPFNTKIHKRELQQSAAPLDKVSLSFVGFDKVDSVPILFPLDVCILQVGAGLKYAAALHLNKSGLQHFAVLKMMNGSYEQVMSVPKPNAVAMDCKQFENKGYISIAMNVSKPIEKHPENVTVIYEISGDRIQPVQYFNTSNLLINYFYVGNDEFFLLQMVANESVCPYFKWCDQIFSHMGYIPCNKAHHLEAFTMNDEGYVAVAGNWDEQSNRKETSLKIYRFSQETQKFELFQKIKMNGEGTGNVRHFQVFEVHERAKHFLVYGNSKDFVIYKFNDKDQFLPYQELALTGVKKFLPLQSLKVYGSCILLVACGKNDIKVFNFEDGKFREESQVHFKGHNFRLYEENLKIQVIIVNERTMENKANIYLPAFKQDKSIANLKKQIIDWTHYEAEKLQTVNIGDLSIKVQEKLQLLEKSKLKLKRNIASPHINTVTTESLVYPKRKMSANYWKALYYINQGLDVLEEELSEKQQRSKRQTPNDEEKMENMEYIYDTLNIKTLTITENLEAKRINNVDLQFPEFKEILTPKITIKDKYSKPELQRSYSNADLDYLQDNEILYIRNLQINGKLNEYTWQVLLNNTLKRKAEIQYIKSSIKIRNLETPRVVVTNNAVNHQHLSSLIPIDGGEYVIEQDIQFAEPISAKNVEIHQRLNNVHVYEGKFDVLLRRSNETQIIEGPKSLNNVKVMEPITIAGQMLGKHLESITPNKAIHQPITLQGDFMINGDVDINFRLKAADIIDLREKMSVKQILEQGIRMDKHLEEVKLKFLEPLKANNSLVSFINKNDLQRLVKLNQDEIQIVESEKTFTGSLEIRRGFSEVKNLNGVDMEKLEKDSFLKNNNQTIKIPMKFSKIQAKSVNSSAILLNNRNLTDYLFKSSNQTIKGNLIIDNLKVKSLKVENLNTNNKIFQQNIQDIYRQKSRNAPQQQEVFVKNQKFHGSIYVKNLVLNSTINERNVDDIEKNLLQLEGNIKYVGNFKFNYPMNVTQLTFYGKLNDINSQDLGRCWLQKNSQQQPQEFEGPQTVGTVNAENGIHFQGKLNGFTMNDFYSKTYWIYRDEYLSDVEFENPIEISSSLTTQTLNHHYIPEELLLLSEAQQLFHPIIITGDLEVQSPGLNVTIMKNINIQALEKYLHDDYMDGLYVENAYFSQGPPSYKTLNYRIIPYVLDNVWLANENVILPQHIEINDAQFEGLLEFEGDMNNMNLEFLKDNYFSRTKSQNISAKMVFSKGVVFEEDLEANGIQLFGPIIEGKSETSFDFMQFVENTLKTTGHPYTIPGNWSLLEAIIDGNLNQVLINQLNLVDDIVHTADDQRRGVQPYVIKAPKRFMHDVSIENLLAEPSSLLNNIPVAKWIKDAVYLYENYTIFGTTKMSSLNVFNDLGVMGQLNNVSFNENSLFLQDSKQTLPGKLRITSHLKGEKRFLTNNIENLYADFINSKYMPGLMDNLIAFATNVEISNHVVFKEPLNVEKYQGPEGLLTQTRWLKRDLKAMSQENAENVENISGRDLYKMQDFEEIADYLKNITKDRFYILDHFEIRQVLNINPSQIQSFSFKMSSGDVVDVMILLDTLSNNVTFYKWLPASKIFMENQDFNWLPKNPALLNIIQKMSKMTNKEPIDVEYLKEFISKLNKKIPNTNLDIEFWNETCLIIYSTSINTPVFKINCVDFNRQMQSTEIMARTTSSNIQQILSLNRNSLALITNNSLEVWNLTLGKLKLAQKFAVNNPRLLSLMELGGKRYLAVITKAMPTSLNSGSIEIYRSLNDDRHFVLWQTLSCPHPTKIEYSYIAQSKDLLLYVLTDLKEKPLIVYQYQGSGLGFQEILTNSILPPHAMDIKNLEIKSSPHFMLGVLGRDTLTIVEIVLRKM